MNLLVTGLVVDDDSTMPRLNQNEFRVETGILGNWRDQVIY